VRTSRCARAAGVDVEALIKEWGIEAPKGRRTLEGDGLKAALRLAELLAVKIDEIQEVV
jgi:hypothetical protein